MYDLPRKFGVGQTYLQLWQLSFLTRPTASELASESNVGWEYADKVIWEIHLHNEIIDPAEIRLGKSIQQGVGNNLISRKTCFFFPFALKSQIDPTWIIVKSCSTTMAL
jgi:hypothetical protein